MKEAMLVRFEHDQRVFIRNQAKRRKSGEAEFVRHLIDCAMAAREARVNT
jgi:hypothetical protein